ncbi:MAG TPA: hypothetical protein VK461_15265, partial [Acidimicrobiales bacterium]|nr:hypothetical protein [Acidimicrobiales bacterium]
ALQLTELAVESCAHVAGPLEQEAAALRDPAGRAQRAAQLESATEEATRLRGAASRWQQVMSDAMADVTNDLADDLRSRFRSMLSSAEEAIDHVDPAAAWLEFEPDFRRQVAETASTHQDVVHERLVAVARRVEAVFSEEEAAIDDLIPGVGDATRDRGSAPISIKEMKKAGVGARTMGAVRASYSGAVLTGFVTGVLGLTLAAPVALAAGAAVGYRGIREDAKRQLTQRQAIAKAAMRQHVDDVAAALSKETRDLVRRTQRTLRDHFTARADELLRSAAASCEAAKRAVALADQQATERLVAVSADLGHVHAIGDLAVRTREGIAFVLGAET